MSLSIVLLLLASVAGGFLAGRYRYQQQQPPVLKASTDPYHQSLRFLLNEQTDGTVDTFLQSLQVNAATLDIHLAVAGLMRRKGEITRAIIIHEHLLNSSSLSAKQSHQVQLELAQDYRRAGLLDRAESLLLPLIDYRSSVAARALEQLLDIHQSARDWPKAIDVASRLHRHPGRYGAHELAQMQSHYACELAEQAIARGDSSEAVRHLRLALQFQQNSVRASLLLVQLACEAGEYVEALAFLKKIPEQDPELVSESLPLVVDCFTRLGDREGLRHYLFHLLGQHKASSLMIAVSDVIAASEGMDAAVRFLELQVTQKPSIRILRQIIDLYLIDSEGKARQNLELLKLIIEKVIAEKPVYLCGHCGFSAMQLHWLCPGCKTWNSVRPLKGVTGE